MIYFLQHLKSHLLAAAGGGAAVPELIGGCEGLLFCDWEHQQEPLPTAEVIVPYGGIVLLARCVQDVDLDFVSVQDHLFPVAVRFGGLVVFHKLQMERFHICYLYPLFPVNDVMFWTRRWMEKRKRNLFNPFPEQVFLNK